MNKRHLLTTLTLACLLVLPQGADAAFNFELQDQNQGYSGTPSAKVSETGAPLSLLLADYAARCNNAATAEGLLDTQNIWCMSDYTMGITLPSCVFNCQNIGAPAGPGGFTPDTLQIFLYPNQPTIINGMPSGFDPYQDGNCITIGYLTTCKLYQHTATAAPVPAPVATLNANPLTVVNGSSSLLSWTCSNSTGASINNGVGAVTPVANGSRTVTPSSTTTYTLTCTSANGTQTTAQKTVTVTNPPACVPDGQLSVNLPNTAPYPDAEEYIDDALCCSGRAFTGGQYYNDHMCTGSGPQCSDLTDNDGDGRIDSADAQCHTDGNPDNPGSYDPNDPNEGGGGAQCSDGLDNDGDGNIDGADSQCHTDGDANDGDPTYDPNDPSEGGGTECSDGTDNDGDGRVDSTDPQCHTDGDANDGDPTYDPNDPSEGGGTECSDGTDNDSDTYVDSNDPGCHTDGDPGDGDNTYDPNDPTEGPNTECSDGQNNDGQGGIDYPNDTDCSGYGDTSEGSNPPTISCTLPSPCTVAPNGSATITWNSNGNGSCTGSGFSTGGASSGSTIVNPGATTAYGVTCGGINAVPATVTVISPHAYITASPERLPVGVSSTQLSFSASQVTASCRITGPTGATVWGPTAPVPLPGPIATTTITVNNITYQSTFTLTCDNGAAVSKVIVKVDGQYTEF